MTSKIAGAHIIGDLKAQKRTGQAAAFNLVKQEALDYAREYKKDLVERGGSYVWMPDLGDRVFAPWMKDYAQELRTAVGDAIEEGIRDGKSVEEVKRDLKKIWAESDRRLRGIAQNEINHAQSDGSDKRYKQTGVEEVEWLLSDHPCDICIDIANHNGGRYKLSEVPGRPVHYGCECDIAPAEPAQESS